MITFIESMIGTTYAQDPYGFLFGFMFVCWFTYLLIQLLYSILGLNR